MRRRYESESDEELADWVACLDAELAMHAEMERAEKCDGRRLVFDEHTHVGGLSPAERLERDPVGGDRQ